MTDPIKLAIEALEGLFTSNEYDPPGGVAVWRLGGSQAPREALAALRSIKPDCNNCKYLFLSVSPLKLGSTELINVVSSCNETCTDFDQFQALPPISLTKVTK